jgi:signal transduction histidine kinase
MEDMDGNFITLNKAADDLLEEMATGFMLGPLRDLSSSDYDPGAEGELRPWFLDYRRFEVGGRMISVESSTVLTDEGERLGTVMVMRDVTDAVKAAEMAAQISHLEELDRQKNEFISIASHELRSPLASAKTFTQNLLDGVYGALNDDQANRLGTVLDRINDEILMVNTLLDLSRLETQRPIIRRPTEIAAIIHGIVDEFRPRAENKGIFLSTGPLEPDTVFIDKRAIWRVLSNLLDNAVKFTPSGGRVTLSAQSRDKSVEIRVADTGIGIPEDQLEQIFEKFYQIDRSTTREFGGMGLGLAIAKEIVEQHGGTIWAESQPGIGSLFYFTIPKATV